MGLTLDIPLQLYGPRNEPLSPDRERNGSGQDWTERLEKREMMGRVVGCTTEKNEISSVDVRM